MLSMIISAAALATLQPAAGPSPTLRPWPVHIVDGDRHPGGKSPLMIVGTLFTGGHCYREDDGNRVHYTPADEIVMPSRYSANKYSKVMGEYLLGNVRPRPSCNEEETCVFLTSPPLENGYFFTVDGVSLKDSTFTVRASFWSDDTKHQWGPGPNREGQLLRLGWLQPGTYSCKLELTHRFCKTADKTPGIYTTESVSFGEVKFDVAKGDPWHFHSWDQEPTKAIVKHEEMKQVKFEAAAPQQLPFYAAKRVRIDPKTPPTDPTAVARVTAPIAWTKWGQKSATLWETPTPAEAPANGAVVVQITGGKDQLMGNHDWAEITAVERQVSKDDPKTAAITIYATVWTRDYIYGDDKKEELPAFAVPVVNTNPSGDLSPADLAKNIKINVIWSKGTDNPRDAVIEVRH